MPSTTLTSGNQPQEKHCFLCIANLQRVSYKDTTTLQKWVSPFSKIVPRRKSGLCMLHQRKVSRAIKRARMMGLFAFTK